MESILLPGQIWRESEFVFDPAGKRWLTGTCGPNAIAMAQSWADQYYHSTLEVYRRLRAARSLCRQRRGDSGASSRRCLRRRLPTRGAALS